MSWLVPGSGEGQTWGDEHTLAMCLELELVGDVGERLVGACISGAHVDDALPDGAW